ncbi:transglycosylase family protein [Kitasatospora sp. NPDC088346]|uniref:LysM peptidoglycan-binding domain-containing protein n=1 Tax=Kitasatospora sp. NPDC088346 TaxID=3364073 RepID=UPI0037FCC65D
MVFSGSGRHRRPTQADRAVAAAGVAGVGLALPLLTATGAHAATADTWQTVAQCQTGADWNGDPGTGHYGGLGLTLRTWVAYGGDEFASQPDHATPEQQVIVAERLLAGHGPSLWPTCGPAAGLPAQTATPAPAPTETTPDTGPRVRGDGAAVPQYFTPTTTPDATTAPAQPGASPQISTDLPGTLPGALPTDQPSGLPTGQPSGLPTDQPTIVPQPGVTPPATPAPGDPTATTPVTPAPTGTAPTGTASPGADLPVPGASPSGTPTAAQDTTAASAPTTRAAAVTAAVAEPAPPNTYTVAPGDTLSTISDSLTLGGWKGLYAQNPTVGTNPDLIRPGQVLNLP